MTGARTLHGVSMSQWSSDFLRAIGAPVNTVTVGIINTWQHAEGAGGDFNPLNTTENAPGSSCVPNTPCVRNFPNYQTGLAANAKAFNLGRPSYGYGRIRQAIIAGDAPGAFQAIHDSSWGTHDIGSGTTIASGGAGNVASGASQQIAPGAGFGKPAYDDECVWSLSLPGPIPNLCLKRSQGRALLGAASIVAGAAIMLAGLAFIGAQTKTGATVVSLGATAAGAAAKGAAGAAAKGAA